MNKNRYHMKLLASFTVLAATTFASHALYAEDLVVAKVNDQAINKQTLDAYAIKRLGVAPTAGFPKDKLQEIIEELVNRELIVQDAQSLKMEEDDAVAAQLAEAYKNALLQMRIKRLLREKVPSEETLKTIYKEEIVDKTSDEYKARHILLKTKEDARIAIDKLDKGAAFAELAKEMSIGPSKNQGGDLGWFASNQMVKPFADAVVKLKKNTYTKHPVHTRFGWHVIFLEDARKVEPPSFDSVKEQVIEMAQNQIIAEYIDKLKANATIEINE